MYLIKTPYNCTFGASFTKQGKLAQERNSKTPSMGGQMSVGDLRNISSKY